jgi:hypothetical protein
VDGEVKGRFEQTEVKVKAKKLIRDGIMKALSDFFPDGASEIILANTSCLIRTFFML